MNYRMEEVRNDDNEVTPFVHLKIEYVLMMTPICYEVN